MRSSRLLLLVSALSVGVGGLAFAELGRDEAAAAARPPVSRASSAVLAACPTAARTGMVLPPGARSFGRLAPVASPLTNGSLDTEAARDIDPKRGFNEEEADDVTTDGATFSYAPGNDMSLLCRYGRGPLPLDAQALVVIPLPSLDGTCRFRRARGGTSASMICKRDVSSRL